MSSNRQLRSIRAWCGLHASNKAHWWRLWHRGYIQACRDVLILLDSEVLIVPLEEFKAIEGALEIYNEAEFPYP